MCRLEKITEGLWTFPIVLPDNPLKWLNCYVIKPENGRNLVIDTGFNREECLTSLLRGMETLNLTPENTDVFLTHMHADHTGNAAALQARGYRLMMSETDYGILAGEIEGGWSEVRIRAADEGMTGEMIKGIFQDNPAVVYRSDIFSAEFVRGGDRLSYGDYELLCIDTPGHTPGHMCLYEVNKKIMFLGDHVLFDITPNICAWSQVDDSLGLYLDSLRRISEFDVSIALPGHRSTGEISMNKRIETLIDHHSRRLKEVESIIGGAGEINAYDISGHMTWQIRARNWNDFPPAQKWFAFEETLAHLDYLTKTGRICRRTGENGRITYTLKLSKQKKYCLILF